MEGNWMARFGFDTVGKLLLRRFNNPGTYLRCETRGNWSDRLCDVAIDGELIGVYDGV